MRKKVSDYLKGPESNGRIYYLYLAVEKNVNAQASRPGYLKEPWDDSQDLS